MTTREKLELLRSYRAAGGTGSYVSLLKEAKQYDGGGIVKEKSMMEAPVLPENTFPYNSTSYMFKDERYNSARANQLYEPDETGHMPTVDYTTGEWLKAKRYPTSWKELMATQLNPELNKMVGHPYQNERGNLQYPKGYGESYALGGPKTTNYPTKSPEGKIIHERKEVYTKEDAYPWEELTEEGKFRNKPYYLPNLPDDNPFQKHNTWMRNWIRRRPEQLKTISSTPDKLLDETVLNLAGTKFKDSRYVRPDSYVGGAWGQYMPGNHSIYFPTSIGNTDETTVVHELGHASKLGKRANSIKIINNVMSKDTKLPTFKSDDRDYYLNPDEVYSRIWELRKDLDFQPAEKIDKKILMDKYKKSTKTNDLFDYLNEDSIVTLLNDLVSTGIIKNRS